MEGSEERRIVPYSGGGKLSSQVASIAAPSSGEIALLPAAAEETRFVKAGARDEKPLHLKNVVNRLKGKIKGLTNRRRDLSCAQESTHKEQLYDEPISATELLNEEVFIEDDELKSHVERFLSLLWLDDYEVVLFTPRSPNWSAAKLGEAIFKLGDRSRIGAGISQLIDGYKYSFTLGKLHVDLRPSDFKRLTAPMCKWEEKALRGQDLKAVLTSASNTVATVLRMLEFVQMSLGRERENANSFQKFDNNAFGDLSGLLEEILLIIVNMGCVRPESHTSTFEGCAFEDGLLIFSAVIAQKLSTLLLTHKFLENHQWRLVSSANTEPLASTGLEIENKLVSEERALLLRRKRIFYRTRSLSQDTPIESFLNAVVEYSAWLWGHGKQLEKVFSHLHASRDLNAFVTYIRLASVYDIGPQILVPPDWSSAASTWNEVSNMCDELQTLAGLCGTETLLDVERPTQISPGWEAPIPIRIGGMSIGHSERSIVGLRQELDQKLRHAKKNDTCAFAKLFNNGVLILSPRTGQAHLLYESNMLNIGFLGDSMREETKQFSKLMEEATSRATKEENINGKSTDGQYMEIPMEGSGTRENLRSWEYGDLLPCFAGTYLVRRGDLWYVVENPRWKRIWKVFKRLS